MSQEWLVPHGEFCAQIAVTRAGPMTKFGQCVVERTGAVRVGSSEEALLALGV